MAKLNGRYRDVRPGIIFYLLQKWGLTCRKKNRSCITFVYLFLLFLTKGYNFPKVNVFTILHLNEDGSSGRQKLGWDGPFYAFYDNLYLKRFSL
jgi:hypothetical protein